ncbi:MAG: electron transport complex subunit RsxE [Clostridia bacterium]|nr:electron transport complex subunit RsxE [Clostridia bacterium]
MKVKDIALDGVVRQNPVFKLVLGTCPALAVSTSLANAIGMGAAVIFVLMCSNILISLLRNVIPGKVRIPAFIMIIATFVTVVILVFEKFLPDLYSSLGMFLPLIVVNCLILARAEAFASVNKVGAAALDGLFMGIGFTLALSVMAFIRELLGTGCLFGIEVLGGFKIGIFASSAGGFLVYGLLITAFVAGSNAVSNKNKQKQAAAEKAARLQAAEAVAASEAEVK